jgi:glycosyltransferase involved in cell wall biosynthesis
MRNAAPFLPAMLRSVLSQANVDLEIIVVDDGSTDGSGEVAREIGDPRIQVITLGGVGIAKAFNAGLDAARGQIITRCDADDLYPPGRLSRQYEWLKLYEEFGAVCGGFATLSPRGRLITDMKCGENPQEVTAELRSGTVRTHFCTFAVRAELLRKLAGCREFFITGEDIDLQLRIGDACRVWYQPQRTYMYRLHNASITHTMGVPMRSFFEATARKLQQQRHIQGLDDLDRNISPTPDENGPHADPPDLLVDQIQGLLLGTAWEQHNKGRKIRSIVTGFRAGLARPNQLPVWRSVAALIVKPSKAADRGCSQSEASHEPALTPPA